MKTLTIVYTTSREKPKTQWFLDSLGNQIGSDRANVWIIFVDFSVEFPDRQFQRIQWVSPKPTVWQGKHRLTKTDWWAKSNAMNTGICLCRTEWIAFIDDRCVPAPTWLESIRQAMAGEYAVCGTYEKWSGMKVENGEIIEQGELLGKDHRPQEGPVIETKHWQGGSCALPLAWCLQVNGYAEMVDGLGMEDSMFGATLWNSYLPMYYDPRMKIIEDRTPSEIGGALKRADKGEGQAAKSWEITRIFKDKKTSQNSYDIRNMRDRVLLNNESLDSMPVNSGPLDWYDQQPISEM